MVATISTLGTLKTVMYSRAYLPKGVLLIPVRYKPRRGAESPWRALVALP